MPIDFGFGGTNLQSNEPTTPEEDIKTDIETGKKENGNGVSDIDDGGKEPEVKPEESDKETKDESEKKDEDKSLELTPNTKVEIGDSIYTVDDKGNLVDDKGAIFKEAGEVADFLKTLEQSDEDGKDDLNINNIIESVGIDIFDDKDNPVQFDNTPEGIKQYVQAVIQTSQNEVAESTINSLFQTYPVVKEVLDYYVANGNSLDGFTERPDRSNIEVDENDEVQKENIIRTAWKEQNRRGDVDNYIAYLKSSGTLKLVAEQELKGLKEADAAYKKQLAEEARVKKEAEVETQKQYWSGVKDVIDSRRIAGYQIPDTILIERNGQKVAATPNDFFNYIYRVDKEGYSQYQRDLMKETEESRRDDEILRAYLKFTGGNYSNLVDMAVNEKEVKRLRFKAKENNSRKTTFKITPPVNNNDKKETDLGY